jgi:phosphosulfolactate phosphohydrolase-like enzyme
VNLEKEKQSKYLVTSNGDRAMETMNPTNQIAGSQSDDEAPAQSPTHSADIETHKSPTKQRTAPDEVMCAY